LAVLLLLALPLVAAACIADEGPGVQNAVAYIEAINNDDIGAAEQYICASRKGEIMAGLREIAQQRQEQSFSYQDLSCSPRGEDVRCSYTVVQELPDGQTETFSREVTYQMENGKVCSFEEEVAQ
jgi:hypothetical protein